MNIRFFKFTIYNYAINSKEVFIIPLQETETAPNYENIIDCFLGDICFCDSYDFLSVKECTEKQNGLYNSFLYTLYEAFLLSDDNISIFDSSIVFRLNELINSLKLYS